MERMRNATPEATENGRHPLAIDDKNANSPNVATKNTHAISQADTAIAGILNTANPGVLKW